MKNWNIRGFSGLKSDVTDKVEADGAIPAADKAFIKARIAALPDSVAAVKVDGVCNEVGNKVVFTLTIAPLF